MLMDFGAEYGNYAADLSRTIPVNGRFTERQKAVYEAVLRVKNEAQQLLRPGNNLTDYHQEVGHIMELELIGLGLLSKEEVAQQNPAMPAYKKYFMHGTSHHIGLDVHDLANRYVEFKEGMVFTCEPGIYIPEEGLGVRIEDDLLITANGVDNLMGQIPIEVEEINLLRNPLLHQPTPGVFSNDLSTSQLKVVGDNQRRLDSAVPGNSHLTQFGPIASKLHPLVSH